MNITSNTKSLKISYKAPTRRKYESEVQFGGRVLAHYRYVKS